jgi:tryptophanyl-tRNA synthetase
LLLQSRAFTSPQEAGRAIGRLQQEGGSALAALAEQLEPADNDGMRAAAEALEILAAQSVAASGG